MPDKRESSIVIGIVKSLDDPENLGRVKVSYPYRDDQDSHWCRLVAPFADKDYGAFFRPDVGAEVLIALQQGDARQPYVLGGLWSQADPPPPDDGNAGENNWRFLRSRSGHVIKLDDTAGAEVIEIFDGSESNRIVIDTAGRKIRVESDSGDVEVKAPAGAVKVEATTVEIKASGTMTLEAGGSLTIKGSVVNIN